MNVYIILPVIIAALDQTAKLWARNNLKGARDIVLLSDVLRFTYFENTGGPLGVLKGRRWVIIALSALVVAGLICAALRKGVRDKASAIFISLVIGGGLGNLIDRIFYGYVIDYIGVSFFAPICNLSDYCITAGTAGLIWTTIAKGIIVEKTDGNLK